MAFQAGSLLLIAVVLVAAYIERATPTITVTSSFDNYNNTINKLSNMNDRLTVLRAVWGELRADQSKNMDHTKTFYDNLLQQTKGANGNEAEEAAELAMEVRHVLVSFNGRLLAETLNHNDSQKIVSVQVYRTQLLNKYSVELTSAIFYHAIDEAFPFKRTDLLHTELDAIDLYPTNANVFKLRVNWNLYLYYKFLQRGEINDKYIYAAAFTLRNFEYSTFYKTLTADTMQRIADAFETYPSELKTLFSKSSICLENVNFNNYLLYFPESNSSTATSYVPAVIRNLNNPIDFDRMVWSSNFADRTELVASNLNLKSRLNNWLLYGQQHNNTVLVQRSDSIQNYRNWTPSLMDNKIMFNLYDHYLCATSQYISELVGFSVQSLPNISLEDPKCQWFLIDCTLVY